MTLLGFGCKMYTKIHFSAEIKGFSLYFGVAIRFTYHPKPRRPGKIALRVGNAALMLLATIIK